MKKLKNKFLQIYKLAYRIERLCIKTSIYTESELYDIRFEVLKEMEGVKNEK